MFIQHVCRFQPLAHLVGANSRRTIVQQLPNGKKAFAKFQPTYASLVANGRPFSTTSSSSSTSPSPSVSVSSSASVESSVSSSVADAAPAFASTTAARCKNIVITVHGYLGLPRPFFLFRAPLIQEGNFVYDYSYSSGLTMDEIADGLNAKIKAAVHEVLQRAAVKHHINPTTPMVEEIKVSFVVHSMGGIVLRTALNNGKFPLTIPNGHEEQPTSGVRLNIGRIIMIATPNRGSEYARTVAKYPRLKQLVLGFAKMPPLTSGLTGLNKWVQMISKSSGKQNKSSSQQQAEMTSSASSPASASAATSAADDIVPDVLACGDLLMTHPPSWFMSHIPLPPLLYPKTLVIAGTMSLLHGLAPQPSDGTITFEETMLPPPVATNEAEAKAIEAPHNFVPSYPSSPVSPGPLGSQHMSFHSQHSLLLAHPGCLSAVLQFLKTGNAEPSQEEYERSKKIAHDQEKTRKK